MLPTVRNWEMCHLPCGGSQTAETSVVDSFSLPQIYRASILNMLTADTMNLLTLFLLRHFNHEQSSQHLTSKAPLDIYPESPEHICNIGVSNVAKGRLKVKLQRD